jgi:phosphoglycolate phosphatase-like HAD superfamily hydrolase
MGKLAELLKDEGQTEQTYTLYCDMDGVLCDFDSRFLEVLRETGKKHYSIKGITSANDFEDKYGKEEFWKFIDKTVGVRFWVGMEWTPSGAKLWNFIKKYNPTLLTSPSRDNNSRLGKRLWVKNHIPGTPVVFKYSKVKQEMATPTSILIDDRKDTIDRWNAAGGIGIYHPTNTYNIDEVIEKLLEVYEGESSQEGV